LLDLFGDRITAAELGRFFSILQGILVASDPVLDLPDDKRFAAQIYGKVRPHSGILIGALCDTLVKLAVRGPQVPYLASMDISGQVSKFVANLLMDADGVRWLSLSSYLQSLAEAAPETFMKAVARSLTLPAAPVTRLITETAPAGLGRCWHAHLLWALETLAWSPEHLPLVALLLARLAHTPVKGNWSNTPLSSLKDIFRTWLPQTSATLSERVAVLDLIMRKEPDIGFDLLEQLVDTRNDWASPNPRPHWREDDAGAGRGVTWAEMQEMLFAVADRLISLAAGYSRRIVKLIEKITVFDAKRAKATLALADAFSVASAEDEDREILRNALRKHISWHRNFDKVRGRALDMKLQAFEKLYARLEPADLVVRHRWLFADGWADLPVNYRDDHSRRGALMEEWRVGALRQIWAEYGWAGVDRLAAGCTNPYWVGSTLAELKVPAPELVTWITKAEDILRSPELAQAIRGVLRRLAPERCSQVIRSVVDVGMEQDWDTDQLAAVLALAPEERTTWDIVATCGPAVESTYWAKMGAHVWLSDDAAEMDFVLRRLLDAHRPLSALEVCHVCLERVEARLLYEMLDRALQGEEPNGPMIDAWRRG
jgi:plasmid stability protein